VRVGWIVGFRVSLLAIGASVALSVGAAGPSVLAADPIPTTTSLSLSPAGPYRVTDPLTLSVTVTPSPGPGGEVTFFEDGTSVGHWYTDADGHVEWLIPGLTAGTHEFSASFTGTDGHAPSQSAPQAITVTDTRKAVTVTVTSDPDPSLRGDTFTVRANVTPNPKGGYVAARTPPSARTSPSAPGAMPRSRRRATPRARSR
jgi:hypothetical protein